MLQIHFRIMSVTTTAWYGFGNLTLLSDVFMSMSLRTFNP